MACLTYFYERISITIYPGKYLLLLPLEFCRYIYRVFTSKQTKARGKYLCGIYLVKLLPECCRFIPGIYSSFVVFNLSIYLWTLWYGLESGFSESINYSLSILLRKKRKNPDIKNCNVFT